MQVHGVLLVAERHTNVLLRLFCCGDKETLEKQNKETKTQNSFQESVMIIGFNNSVGANRQILNK